MVTQTSEVGWCKPRRTTGEKIINFCPIIREVLKLVEECDKESLANKINTVFLPLGTFLVFFQTFMMKLLHFLWNTPKEMKNICHHGIGS